MEYKNSFTLKWQNKVYEVKIKHPWPGQDENKEVRSMFAMTIDEKPKQLAFYLNGSLMEPKEPDLINPYLEKLFKITFTVGGIKENENKIAYFQLFESSDYGATTIWVSNNEARMEFKRSL